LKLLSRIPYTIPQYLQVIRYMARKGLGFFYSYSNNFLITKTGEYHLQIIDFATATFDTSHRYLRKHNEKRYSTDWYHHYVNKPVLAILEALPDKKNEDYDQETVRECKQALLAFSHIANVEEPFLKFKERCKTSSTEHSHHAHTPL
jgi:hypothetical protein